MFANVHITTGPVAGALRAQSGERLVAAVRAVRAERPHQDLAVLVGALAPGARDRRARWKRASAASSSHRHIASWRRGSTSPIVKPSRARRRRRTRAGGTAGRRRAQARAVAQQAARGVAQGAVVEQVRRGDGRRRGAVHGHLGADPNRPANDLRPARGGPRVGEGSAGYCGRYCYVGGTYVGSVRLLGGSLGPRPGHPGRGCGGGLLGTTGWGSRTSGLRLQRERVLLDAAAAAAAGAVAAPARPGPLGAQLAGGGLAPARAAPARASSSRSRRWSR